VLHYWIIITNRSSTFSSITWCVCYCRYSRRQIF